MIRPEMYSEYLLVRQKVVFDFIAYEEGYDLERALEWDHRFLRFTDEERRMFEEMYMDHASIIFGEYPNKLY
ncbi:hypothetical protein GZ22_18535 (plasmid) [Terribacillus saccharophilus]|uniref:Uncharacterized protein n=1 Tax=Terribacillus saccharophilus TaxID=361277 RepID=A0A075LVC5_9BACI|nr:hypothetical protein [Terribacillus goriensis]AIF68423.1 hypothetical protein GZ22_18535 [Terribacillus goriensis]